MTMRDLQRTLDRLPLEWIMPAAFAAALAFALYAMPGWLIARAVSGTGLATPLGGVTRAAMMLVAAAAGGAAVWRLFAWLEGAHRSEAAVAATPPDLPGAAFAWLRRLTDRRGPEVPATVPTLRRADAHPDAPARRPIFAAADLGAPLDQAPDVAWRGDEPQSPPVSAGADELLLEQPVEPMPPFPAPPSFVPRATTSSDLIARLESELRRRGGTAPPSRLTLRSELLKLRASV